MKTINRLFAVAVLSSMTVNSFASMPEIKTVQNGVILSAISDNGLWVISADTEDRDEAGIVSIGGKIWDTATMTGTSVPLPKSGVASINDVTDDGNIVVGSCDGQPGFWTKSTNQWTVLPLPSGTKFGTLLAVTPDGSRAVGYANVTTEWNAVPVYYNLDTKEIIDVPNLPALNMNHEVADYHTFTGISPDGRYLLGRISPEILLPISMCAYVYDTKTGRYNFIGFNPSDSKPWTPVYEDLLFIEGTTMSPDGHYVTGDAYIGHPQDGSEWLDEYRVAYLYDVYTGKTEIYDGVYDADVAGFSVTDSGVVLAATPALNPYSSFMVRNGNYYYGLDEIFKQVYGIDFYQKTGMAVTGKPSVCSADGKTVCVITSQTDSYLLQMPDDWETICSKVNLLSNYSVNPPAESVFSSLSEMTLTFRRNVEIAGSPTRIKLLDADGNELRSAAKAEANKNIVTINFRAYKFEAGKKYTVVIPANLISMVGNMNVGSGEIRVEYVGRADGSVMPISISPADGSSFARLDASTNPVTIRFNASIRIADGARGELWRKGETAPFAEIDFSLYNSSTLLAYPLSRQYLYEGTDYQLVIPASSVTDLGGDGGNDEIVLNYSGSYVREISADDKYLFSDDCSNYANFLFYEGDHLTPGSVPASWGFTADNPWSIVRSSTEASDMAMAAHSMYANGGKADDWMVTPQIYIPDTQCYLTFDAQSYKSNKSDRLKVYAIVSDNVYSTLTDKIISDFRASGKLIFDEVLKPGATEEGLDDEWETYNVMLNEFEGKNIYIAFVNENENQSAIFIDNVDVIHDMKFLTSITSSSTVVAAKSAPVSGSVTIASDLLTANSVDVRLLDASGNEVSKVSQAGLELKKGGNYNFTFPGELPLKADVSNRFIIHVTVNGTETSSASGVIKNMAFAPVRRVVIEEFSGRECSNCPQGFVAMENLERIYPGQILPIILRTYENDPLGQGMHNYTEFLGINNLGAPSALINRTIACYPMVTVGMDYRFSGEGISLDGESESVCWLDAVSEQMQTLPDADLEFNAVYDGSKITVQGNARWALDTDLCNANVFAVVTEDNLESIQMNGMYTVNDPDLGEWANDGKYATRYPTVVIDGVGRGVSGSTYNGTPGLIPSKLSAGVDYPLNFAINMPETVADAKNANVILMLIDGDNDHVINANIARVDVQTAIEEIVDDEENAPVEYFDIQGRRVANPAKGSLVIKKQGSKVSKIIF